MSVDKAIKRYSSLFTLPKYKIIVIILLIQCLVTALGWKVSQKIFYENLFYGLWIGVLLFLSTISINYLTSIIMQNDVIMNARRLLFLSLISNIILSFFVLVAKFLSKGVDNPNYLRIMCIGIFPSLILRLLVLESVSFKESWRNFFASIIHPLIFLIPFLFTILRELSMQIRVVIYIMFPIILALIGINVYISALNVAGMSSFGIPTMAMFKAFIVNWAENIVDPLEGILEKIGEISKIIVSLLVFRTNKKVKAAFVVPSFHSGPFRNVGSSSMPSIIQKVLENKMRCVVAVPHGISGHEKDLASQAQNKIVLNNILRETELGVSNPFATPFLSVIKNGATASCQLFGDCCFISLTLAPETMEDMPPEIIDYISYETQKNGLATYMSIDAHNSFKGSFDIENALEPLKEAVKSVVYKSSRYEKGSLYVGASKTTPQNFRIEDGMGPGGISVIVTQVGEQKVSYVTIDGNNMVSGLREQILSNLRDLGFDGGEVFTTDTHIVNAVTRGDKGYYAVGELINHESLIDEINKTALKALRNLEPAFSSWKHVLINNVKAVGKHQIDEIIKMIDEVAMKAKRMAFFLFPFLWILSTLPMFFF